jgi:flagellar FliL protein
MMKKLLPVILVVVGTAAGVGGGIFMRPAADPDAAPDAIVEAAPSSTEFVKLNNQFVIPVVEKGRVAALVIMSLTLEISVGGTEAVYTREPKLRDAMLQVMFDHANTGGFKGVFTDAANLVLLRRALKEVAVKTMGDMIKDVLISDIARQDS